MPHLITEQMRGRVHFCHHRAEGVPQIMILELNSQLRLDFPRRIFHTVDAKDFSPPGCHNRTLQGKYVMFRGENIMKKLIALILFFSILLCATVAIAEGKLTVTSKNAIIKIGNDSGIFVARVENTGDEPIY